MSNAARLPEGLGQNIDPVALFSKLKDLKAEKREHRPSSITSDDVRNNYLRTEFVAVEDIDAFVAELDSNDEIDLTKAQIKELKADLAAFKEYLPGYLADFGDRVGKLTTREKEAVSASKKYVADSKVRAKLARERRTVAQAVFQAEQISSKPHHAGTTLKEGMVGLAIVKYHEFIDGLGLSVMDTKKMKEAMSREKYESARATALELNPNCKIPSRAELVDALMLKDKAWFEYICVKQEAPRVAIVTANGFNQNVTAMNEHRHYTREDGKTQEPAYVNFDSDSPYRYLPKQQGGEVTFVDGVPHRAEAELKDVSSELGERRDHLVRYYAAMGMRLIGAYEMATLIQMSLREAEAAGDDSLIVDSYKGAENRTVTILNPDLLGKSGRVAYSAFDSRNCQVCFGACSPKSQDVYARGRGSAPFFKF